MRKSLVFVVLVVVASLSSFNMLAQSPFDRGMDALNKGDYKNALEYFQQEVKANSSNSIAYYFIGLLHDQNEDYGHALQAFEQALKYAQGNKNLISDTYKCRAGVYVELGKTDEALADYAMAIKTNGKNADAYDDRGNLYWLLDDYDNSDKDYQKAMKLEPNEPEHMLGFGRNAESRKDYQAALKYYTQAIAVKPDNGIGYRLRADVYAELKDYEACAMDIVKALELKDSRAFNILQDHAKEAYEQLMAELKTKAIMEPRNSQWKYYQAAVSELNKKYEDAIGFYIKSNALYPSDVTDMRIASCYDNLCQWDKSIEYTEAAIKKNPDNEDNVLTRAGYKYSYGDSDGAIADVSLCIESHPDLDWLYQKRGWYEANMKMDDAALADFSKALELNPEYAHAYVNRGAILMLKGEKDKAYEDFRMALELDKDIEGTNFSAIYAYAYMGLNEEAESWMNKIIEYREKEDYYVENAYYEATCMFSIMNMRDKALEYFEKALKGGYNDYYHFLQDRDLDNIRDTEKFKELLRTRWPECLKAKGINVE